MPIYLPESTELIGSTPPDGTIEPLLDTLTPRQIVAELDKYVISQAQAKRAVAVALRNRMRRQKLPPDLAEEVAPKNILMIGPTGVGKTEIARRLARLAHASPEIRVESLVSQKLTPVDPMRPDDLPAHTVPNPFHTKPESHGMIDIDGRRYDRDSLRARLGDLAGGAALPFDPQMSYAVCHEDPAVWLAAFFAILGRTLAICFSA